MKLRPFQHAALITILSFVGLALIGVAASGFWCAEIPFAHLVGN